MTMNDIQRNAQALVAAPEPDGCIAAQTYMSSSLLPLTMSTERQGDAQMQPAPEPLKPNRTMIKLNLVVTPGTCNLLLMSMAAAQEQIGMQMDAIRAQGDEQMRPPAPVAEVPVAEPAEPVAEAAAPAPVDQAEATDADQ
jgi:hypothetical protein